MPLISPKKARTTHALFGAFGMVVGLAFLDASASARESGFLDQVFEPGRSEPYLSGTPPQLGELDTETGAAQPRPQRKRLPLKRKVVINAPLPPPRPWGMEDAPPSPALSEHASIGLPPAAAGTDASPVSEARVIDRTATIAPPVPLPLPSVFEPRSDVAAAAQPHALIPMLAPADDIGSGLGAEPNAAPALAPQSAAPAVEDEIETAATDIAPDCKAVLLVRKGAFDALDMDRLTVARGQIGDGAFAQLVGDSIPGLTLNVRDLNWTAGLLSLASGQVDGVMVGVDRMRPEDLQQVWLGFYQLVQLPLRDSGTWSCPRPAS